MPEQASDTGYYVYGIVRATERPDVQLVGLDEAAVEYVESDELAAAVGRIGLDRPPGRRADLMAHDRVVGQLADRGCVIPAQFGSVMASADEVLHHLLDAQRSRWHELLDRFEGAREYLVKATYREDQVLGEVIDEDPRIAELRRRTRDLPAGTPHPDLVRLGELVAVAMGRKRAEDAGELVEVVRGFSTMRRERDGSGVDHVVTLAVLVPETRQADFEEALEHYAETRHQRIRVGLSGPLPPYDFVEPGSWD